MRPIRSLLVFAALALLAPPVEAQTTVGSLIAGHSTANATLVSANAALTAATKAQADATTAKTLADAALSAALAPPPLGVGTVFTLDPTGLVVTIYSVDATGQITVTVPAPASTPVPGTAPAPVVVPPVTPPVPAFHLKAAPPVAPAAPPVAPAAPAKPSPSPQSPALPVSYSSGPDAVLTVARSVITLPLKPSAR
jgi:hypothetical protein